MPEFKQDCDANSIGDPFKGVPSDYLRIGVDFDVKNGSRSVTANLEQQTCSNIDKSEYKLYVR